MRSWVAVVGIAGTAVALVGCGSDRVNGHDSPAVLAAVGTKSPAAAVVASASPSASAMPGTPLARPAGRPSWTERGSSPRCRSNGLVMSFGYTEGAAGHRYTSLVFTNKTGHVCHLQGYPGVSVLDADKTQLGPAVSYEVGNPHRRLELRSGAAASTVLHWTSDAAGMCRPESTYLRVYPPGDTVPIVVRRAFKFAPTSSLFATSPQVPRADEVDLPARTCPAVSGHPTARGSGTLANTSGSLTVMA